MLDSLSMQISGETLQSLVASIVALATAVAAIAGLIAKFVQTHSNNQKVKEWATKVAADSDWLKQSLEATDKWVLENQSKFTSAMNVVNSVLTPEQQQALAAQGVDINRLRQELDDVTKELDNIYGTAPATRAVITKLSPPEI
jgi:L-lactate permease